ncbi:MAG TPA: MupA/Atu3671 family FMN-dependent luciferase-like monooxygenase [Thermoanaerobaculia bacterium]|jgi:natural product biosynthesis luciferase-like monooxygenase protein|nr:MupA/Atu3671 family FMN-dependent luciferase-like monooxygenase [Thermoanaerobaculia bacterium]
MEFGIMFFSSQAGSSGEGRYRLLLEAAALADRSGFSAVWTPERHFHDFGGLFPSPAVVSAALAMVTKKLQIRAGSLISPLHDDVRIAEEWSVVDNLSGGRAAISFGSGWNVDDFTFFPDRYPRRQAVMYEQIETVRRLWRGDVLVRDNTYGKPVEIALHPRPVQRELPVWITSSGNAQTFVSAGVHRTNVLTHLIGQDVPALAEKIAGYRAALAEHHAGAPGKVSLMLHSFLGTDVAAVKARVREPFREYLRSAISLEQLAAAGGGAISGGHRIEAHDIPPDAMEDLLNLTFERYFDHNSLMGTPASCQPLIARLEEIGVDEIACLVDFIDDPGAVLESLQHLGTLCATCMSSQVEARRARQAFLEDFE